MTVTSLRSILVASRYGRCLQSHSFWQPNLLSGLPDDNPGSFQVISVRFPCFFRSGVVSCIAKSIVSAMPDQLKARADSTGVTVILRMRFLQCLVPVPKVCHFPHLL